MQSQKKDVVRQFRLSEDDRRAVSDLVREIASDPLNGEEETFLDRSSLFAHSLPHRIREIFYEFRLRENAAVLLVTNNPISGIDIPPTPSSHWRPGEKRLLLPSQMIHGLYASLLGESFGFETQQFGRIFNDLIPLQGMPGNSSSGSGDIGLHTEDCFQPFMPDYLGLMCLRNEQRAVTTLSCITNLELPETVREILFEERFVPKQSNQNGKVPIKRSILFGDRTRPYLRFGAIDYNVCDKEAANAMKALASALERNRLLVTLSQGDAIYVDNFYAVHGRAAYEAEIGPRGRWFCRLVVLRDIRRTRQFRSSPESRVMLARAYAS